MGQVCAKHNEYYETACPWCEEPEVPSIVMGADEFNAHIAEAAAVGRARRESENITKNNALLDRLKDRMTVTEMPRWPKDKAT